MVSITNIVVVAEVTILITIAVVGDYLSRVSVIIWQIYLLTFL